MKHTIRLTVLLLLLMIPVVFLCGCRDFAKPMTADEVLEFLEENHADIELVRDYLRDLPCESAYISNGDGSVFYEFASHEIQSREVKGAVRRLWREGCEEILMGREEETGRNTISFQLWHRTIGSLDGGLACTVDGTGVPHVQFQTAYEDLGGGWFWYYADYEAWRTLPQEQRGA